MSGYGVWSFFLLFVFCFPPSSAPAAAPFQYRFCTDLQSTPASTLASAPLSFSSFDFFGFSASQMHAVVPQRLHSYFLHQTCGRHMKQTALSALPALPVACRTAKRSRN